MGPAAKLFFSQFSRKRVAVVVIPGAVKADKSVDQVTLGVLKWCSVKWSVVKDNAVLNYCKEG
jgi:hypothetical protein